MKMLTKEEAAVEIAEFTYLVDEETRAIYRAFAADEDAPEEPLKLLKVNADTPPMGILPLHSPPKVSEGMDFLCKSVVCKSVVVTPAEFDDLQMGRLSYGQNSAGDFLAAA